jgi:hypothetical protein
MRVRIAVSLVKIPYNGVTGGEASKFSEVHNFFHLESGTALELETALCLSKTLRLRTRVHGAVTRETTL